MKKSKMKFFIINYNNKKKECIYMHKVVNHMLLTIKDLILIFYHFF